MIKAIISIIVALLPLNFINSAQEPSFNDRITHSLNKRAELTSIESPNMTMPEGVYSEQIVNIFQLDDLFFALALDNSYISGLWKLDISYVGVLIANKNDTQWTKYIEIKDVTPPRGNDPYYLWTDESELLLSIVDSNGAGSSEGYMKVFAFNENSPWQLEGCYYYGPGKNYPNFGDFVAENDRYSFSKDLFKYDKIAKSNDQYEYCENVEVNLLP